MANTFTSNNIQLSLYSHYWRYKSVPGNHDILLTNVNEKRNLKDKTHSNKNDFTIKHTLAGTNIEIQLKLEYIENVEDVNLVQWIRTFKQVEETCQWADKEAILVLTQLTKLTFTGKSLQKALD